MSKYADQTCNILSIDIGSVAISVVEISDERHLFVIQLYQYHNGQVSSKLKEMLSGTTLDM